MKQKFNTSILTIIALLTVLTTLIHGSNVELSIFHGMILHPIFLLAGLSLLAVINEGQKN